MEKYKYYYKNGAINKTFYSAEDCAEYVGVSKYDVINGCKDRSKTSKYNRVFSRELVSKYDNAKFLRENPRNAAGEFILQNKIPGVTKDYERTGILVEHIPTGYIYMNLLEASEMTETNVGLILMALKNRGTKRNEFRTAFHDMTHQFDLGVKEIGWYSPTFDARKIDPDNLGDETNEILERYLKAQKEVGLSAEQVMTNSQIEYYDIEGNQSAEFGSIAKLSEYFRIHPTHVLEALYGHSQLNGRFKLL